MVYASSGQMKWFECGDEGHKRYTCPHKQQAAANGSDVVGGTDQTLVATVVLSCSERYLWLFDGSFNNYFILDIRGVTIRLLKGYYSVNLIHGLTHCDTE